MIPEEQRWLLPGHEPDVRPVVLTPRDVILPSGLICYPDGSPRGFLVGPTRANLASLNPKEEPPVPRNPRPCRCGHPPRNHATQTGYCVTCALTVGAWCPGFRKVKRTEPLRVPGRVSREQRERMTELARRLREQYGPPSTALSQPAPRLPLQEEERDMVRTVIRPALKAGYRLSSDDPEVQALIDEERQVAGAPDEAVRRWVKGLKEQNRKRPQANVTGDQLLEEIDSLAEARRGAGKEQVLRAGPDPGDVPPTRSAEETPDVLDVIVDPGQPSITLPRLESGRYRLHSEALSDGMVQLRLERVPDPEPAAASQERCTMRRWEGDRFPERCDRAEGHDGPHLFLPSPPTCGASSSSGYTCDLEPGHDGRHRAKFTAPASVSWANKPEAVTPPTPPRSFICSSIGCAGPPDHRPVK